jgi:hypothetical protein
MWIAIDLPGRRKSVHGGFGRNFLFRTPWMLPLSKGDAIFKKIEGNPRYKAFLKKMKLPA